MSSSSEVDNIVAILKGVEASSFQSEADRVRFRDALFATLRKVQTPWDIVWEHNWVNGTTNASIKTLIDAGVFPKMVENDCAPKTSAELAKLTGADEKLLWGRQSAPRKLRRRNTLGRLLSQISGQNLVIETAEDTFAPTEWVKGLVADPALNSTYGSFYSDLNSPIFCALPFFLKETGFRNPTDANSSNFQYWQADPNINFFNFVGTNKKLTASFNDAMECHSRYNLTPWPEVYPTETLVADLKTDRPVIVDLGGGKGHDLQKFSDRHPDLPKGSLVLQDLGDILTHVKTSDSISVQPHDFFTPEPIKGARAYFMHNVLHDWEDSKAVKILKNIAGSMERGYSKVLIHESLVSSVAPASRVTVSDITVMACLSAKERTEKEWHSLLEEAGLEIVKIWRPIHSVESVIEAELA
ncbi:O-methyltransferase [Geosmithia morbida]|uniref:O-methyltransferase n=1 Tax=Geosmithia morbida TaxID=1094350 RepID=A0A9P4YS13_9HYPO|nr:O-methyltransferase [Geosmithia morbida]KAF4120729.1 O-methyltransferase [Geosmithia morbida]